MNLWTLERLRLWRTQRWLILLAVYGVFGILGPLTAKYLPDLIGELDPNAAAQLPPLTPEDGITQYIGNVAQMGLLAVAFVAAAALAFDAKVEMSVFLRTRAPVRDIFSTRFVTNAVAAVVAFCFGMAIAYVGTGVLLEWLDVPAIVVGTALHSLYLVFVVAVIGFIASVVRKVPAVALLSVGVLIVVGLLGLIPQLAPWLPSELVGAVDVLIRGGEFEFWRATITTIVLSGALAYFAIKNLENREI